MRLLMARGQVDLTFVWKCELHVLVSLKQKAGMRRSASWSTSYLHTDNEFLHIVDPDVVVPRLVAQCTLVDWLLWKFMGFC